MTVEHTAVLIALSLLVAGCAPDNIGTVRPPGDDDFFDQDDDNDSEDPPEQVPGGDPGDDDDDDDPEDASWIFSISEVHQINLEFAEDAVLSLYESPYDYVEASVAFDGVLVDSVGVRLKGRIGSFRDLSGKSAFKIDFNHTVDGQRFHGLEKLNLHNLVQDESCLHERTAYSLWEAAGVPAPRVGYAWVQVNGEPYGLYTVVEAYDDRFLQRAFDDPSGNLYDGDYKYWEDGTYTLVDFNPVGMQYFVLDEGVDVDQADLAAVREAIMTSSNETFLDVVGAVVDLDHHVRMWAVEAWVGHYDSYTYNVNNYRVYFDPSDGRAKLLPWDPDWAFYEPTPVMTPYGAISYGCKGNDTCHQAFLDALTEVSEIADEMGLDDLEQIAGLIAPYLQDDPRREISYEDTVYSQDLLRYWIQTRSELLTNTPGL